ncbi:MAG: hypothetical protein GC164_13215 [Phycisphaera sp.]|nr:hypothetical protein [Phycisphaera sp.]
MNANPSIDRQAVVGRHPIVNPPITDALALGDGECCFGIDATGLQTFDGHSLAHWAKHANPLPDGLTAADIPETGTFDTGPITGHQQNPVRTSPLGKWMIENPHPINLGRLRFVHADGRPLTADQLRDSQRTLDIWQGVQTASFAVKGQAVHVTTMALARCDGLAVRIRSPLLTSGQLVIELDFPYPTPMKWKVDTTVGDFSPDTYDKHGTSIDVGHDRATFHRRIDDDRYAGQWRVLEGAGRFEAWPGDHRIRLTAEGDVLAFICVFASDVPDTSRYATFADAQHEVADAWRAFWRSGGAIDLSGSSDPRWFELERRVVLSQYLMRANNAGSLPPAEFALMNNDPWQGRFHMEMVWWHMAHYGLWGRWELAERALDIYQRFLPIARKRAAQLTYRGAKWGKKMSPDGLMGPWLGNLQLNWQQPHPIFFAELEYRLRPTQQTLEKWAGIVHDTAEFMASFPVQQDDGFYHLMHVMTANENGTCHDPTFESAYWRWGLDTAQQWRQRMGLSPEPTWRHVRDNLAPLCTEVDPKLGKPIFRWCSEWVQSHRTKHVGQREGHPDLIGAFAFVPFVEGVDRDVAANTVQSVAADWQMGWGWDCPWFAMAAARTDQPDLAIDVLLREEENNFYSARGICNDWYFPGNGGVLYAVAMMAAGWDGCPDRHAPGFPDNGTWSVRFEGLHRAP